jgi:hypothetical protein
MSRAPRTERIPDNRESQRSLKSVCIFQWLIINRLIAGKTAASITRVLTLRIVSTKEAYRYDD